MYDLVVVGAGPYGLSVAAHAAAQGLEIRVFGQVMSAWRAMPPGMLLKSEPWASNLSDPAGSFGLVSFANLRGVRAHHGVPLPVGFFASYGEWFARQAVPSVDERMVESVRPAPEGFEITTEDGEVFRARTVALAIGVLPFADVPEPLRHLVPDGVTHSSHTSDLGRFAGQDVTVVGAGQAALETAVLLTEQGAHARIIARADRLNWNTLPPSLRRGGWEAVRAPHTGLGCGWQNWLYAEAPGAFRRLPATTRARLFATALGPAGAWWLRHRFDAVPDVRLGRTVTAAVRAGDRLRLTVARAPGRLPSGRRPARARGDGGTPGPAALTGGAWAPEQPGPEGTVETDHVIAATGFAPRLERTDVLSGPLRQELRTVGASGAPEMSPLFESSHPGLFMAGLLTAPSCGPSMRFVYGASYTAERLVRGVVRRLRAKGPEETPAGTGGAGRPKAGSGAVARSR
ncbi:NAD(P)-binding domain-containing protein [Streptomyces sp. SP18CS02]|uniref:NAD(P)-binding domain-containing protein n=1 Tax=Streptomyces sp. SP18CS02 TaxID=3002531 RepID=UPI002E759F9F|nr:NAD(P)-binding domain-containing protein [Streptomyces sp. SP18CS02]MEE1751101.1 NAD(P)-binding domain-containing protein [Streptomyces sp. SP18CS02]